MLGSADAWALSHSRGIWKIKHLGAQTLQHLNTGATRGTLFDIFAKHKGGYYMGVLYLKTTDATRNRLKFRK